MITPRRCRVSDKPALYDMLAVIWPDESAETLDQRWWWRCAEPPLWLAVDDAGNVAGMCGHIPFVATSAGTQYSGAWIVDFFVRPGYQGLGIGKLLVRAIDAHFAFLASLNQTDAAYAAFSRAGWSERRYVPFLLSFSPRTYLLASLARTDDSIQTESGPPRFDASFDGLVARFPLDLVSAVRDRAALTQRFGNSPRKYHLTRAFQGGTLAGYAVMRVLPPGSIRSFGRFPIVMVSDYLAPPNDSGVFTALMREVARFALAQRVRFILCMSTQSAHQRALSQGGFLSHHTPMVGRQLGKLAVGFATTPSAPAGNWHLTPYDCDLDLLFGARV